ncbi:MAG: membrane protein insertase YidC [Bacteroidales bacterium]|nr:membrane protein insertase YidC [Bacteroidales bacterium]
MNWKSILGFVLALGIFIGFMWWVSPTEEQIAEQREKIRQYNDSLEAVRLDSIAYAQLEEQRQALRDSLAATSDSTALNAMAEESRTSQLARYGTFGAGMANDTTCIKIKNSLMQIEIAPCGAAVNKVTLSEYVTFDSLPLVLITPSNDNFNLIFSTSDNKVVNSKDMVFHPYLNGNPLESREIEVTGDSAVLSMRVYAGNDTAVGSVTAGSQYLEFRYVVYADRYEVDFDINFVNLGQHVSTNAIMGLTWQNSMNRQEKVDQSLKGSRSRNKDAERLYSGLYYKPLGDKVDNLRDATGSEDNISTPIEWIAYKQQFFCAILVADSVFENARLKTSLDRSNKRDNYLCDMYSDISFSYDPKDNACLGMSYYFGPSKYRDLREQHKGFERMLPLGWGFFLTQWISRYAIIPVFNFLEQWGWNYGVIVLMLTFLLRLVLFPLTFKSYQGSAIMRILRPEMEALNKKYPNQEQMMDKQREMSKLQKKAGYSPMAGCLPMLIQLPIIWAMFRFYPASIELRQKPFLWCDDLSTYDSVLNLGFSIPIYGDHVSLFCLLMFGVQFFYTWYTMRDQQAQMSMPGMKLMMYFMPFMMLFIFNSQSAALNLYYFTSLTLTMIQMILIRRFTSEKKVRARMAAYDAKMSSGKGKPQKKSKFQQRLEEMQKMAEQMQKEQNKRR